MVDTYDKRLVHVNVLDSDRNDNTLVHVNVSDFRPAYFRFECVSDQFVTHSTGMFAGRTPG